MGSEPVTGELVALVKTGYFFVVSVVLTISIRKALPGLKSPVVVNGTDSDVPTHKVDVVNELVATVGTRTVIVAVAGLPGKPIPQPLLTVVI